MYIDVHRCRMPGAQYSIMRQIQIEQVSAALSGFRIVTAVRQVWKVLDHIDRVRSMPQLGTWGVNRDRAETQVKNAADSLFGKSRKIAVGFRPTFRMLDHLVGKTIFFRILRDDRLFIRHHCRPFVIHTIAVVAVIGMPHFDISYRFYTESATAIIHISLRSQRIYVTAHALILLRLRHAEITYVASQNGSHRMSRVCESEQGFRPIERRQRDARQTTDVNRSGNEWP